MHSSFRVLGPALAALAVIHCTPDFDALGNGGSAGGAAGDGTSQGGALGLGGKSDSGGLTAMGGLANTAGRAQGGGGAMEGGAPATGGTEAGGPGEGGSSGSPSLGGATNGGSPANGGTNANGGTTTNGGSGGENACALSATTYTGFDDKSLQGPNLAPTGTENYSSDSTNATGVVAWSATEGKTCPGAFKLTATFKGYQSTTSKTEAVSGIVDIGKPPNEMDWTGATRLHMWVKVSTPSEHLQGVQAFVTSSSWNKYHALFDSQNFRDGDWHEIVVELPADALDYDATKVDQFGIQGLLAAAPPAIDPPTLPVTNQIYVDDVWLDFTP